MQSRVAAIGFLAAGLCGATTPAPPAARVSSLFRSLPVRFEQNIGQWDPRVKFLARTGAYSLSLGADAAVVAAAPDGKRIAVSFPGSKPAGIEGAEPYALRTNYFVGKRASWRTGVANYARVRYREVYPGVDVVYYGNGQHLEYDFALRPGADPAAIRMEFRGAERVSLTQAGDLAIEAGQAKLVQKRPSVYQDGRQVDAHYRLLGANLAAIELGKYDGTRALTIDPVLYYGTLVGSTGTDSIVAVKADATGYVYVAGTAGAGDVGPAGYYQAASKGGSDVFVAKFDPNTQGPGSMTYFTYLGGTADDIAEGMTIDSSGNAYLTGSTRSADFPVTTTAAQSKIGGATEVATNNLDAFVVKLNTLAAGASALAYSTYLGGAGDEVGNAVAVDAAGAIYVGGYTKSDDFPKTANAAAAVKWGLQDAFFAKIDPAQSGAASLPYATYIGGEANDEVTAISVAPNGQVWMAGNTSSTMYPLAGAFAYGPRGSIDIFISRLDLAQSGVASIAYTTMFGGLGVDEVKSIAFDAQNRLVLTGYTLSSDFPVTPNAISTKPLGESGNVFVSVLDFSKPVVLDYSTYLGGGGGDVAYGVAVDGAGNILVTGYTLSPDFPVTKDATQAAYTGGVNAFFTVFNPATPGVKFSTFLGNQGVHTGYGVAAAPNGRMYVAGTAGPARVPVTSGAFNASFEGGASDGFVLVFNP